MPLLLHCFGADHEEVSRQGAALVQAVKESIETHLRGAPLVRVPARSVVVAASFCSVSPLASRMELMLLRVRTVLLDGAVLGSLRFLLVRCF